MSLKSRSEATIDNKNTYMITISCQQKKDYIDTILLLEVLMWLKMSIDSLQIMHFVYENSGKYRQLHWHGIVTVKKNFRYSPFTAFGAKHITGNTYIVNWTRVYNLKRAIDYLHKDLRYRSQEEIISDNYYTINRFNEVYLD